jgi:hypothetical protein
MSKTAQQKQYLNEEVLCSFSKILECQKTGLIKRVLKVLNWAISAPDPQFRANLESQKGLMPCLEKLRDHSDRNISIAAA